MDITALFTLSYGVYMLGTNRDGKRNGCIVNTVTQTTSSPVRLTVAVNKDNYSCGTILATGHFSVSVFTVDAELSEIGRFGFSSGLDTDKFEGLQITEKDGLPYLTEHTCAVLFCRVLDKMDAGTHMVFLAEVEDAMKLSAKEPMTYAYYHKIKKGTTPAKASSFGSAPVEANKGYRCTVCGHIHEGEFPENFLCPVCGKGKEYFVKL